MNKEDTTPPPQKKKFTFDRNAKGVRELLSMKFDVMQFDGPWYEAFGTPERRGVWIIWGNSGSGKTSFALQLCKYLCRFGRVAYDSMEEGACRTMQDAIRRTGMMEVNKRFLLIDNESMEELSIRLRRQKSPDIVVIDSFQYTRMTYRQYIDFKEQHKRKLLIFISTQKDNFPMTRCQRSDVRCLAENLRGRFQSLFKGSVYRTRRTLRHRAGESPAISRRRIIIKHTVMKTIMKERFITPQQIKHCKPSFTRWVLPMKTATDLSASSQLVVQTVLQADQRRSRTATEPLQQGISRPHT